MKVAFVLPGFHRHDRGAEVALLAVAEELARRGDTVTAFGSGQARPGTSYGFVHVPAVSRERFERFPFVPPFRSETVWEEASFVVGLLGKYRPADYDVTVTCSYPFVNWALRRPVLRGRKPLHVFVTQNGDWMAQSQDSEFRFFGCDGLVCTNPDYYERNRERWTCALIPNGMNPDRFTPGPEERASFGLPADKPIVLMVSALIPTKRVDAGIRSVAKVPGAHLAVAGDGPMRDEVLALADQLMPGRFTRLTLTPDRMPALYRSADAFLHMSYEEAFGNVFVEALACGLPVIGHDIPRLRWIVGNDEMLCDTDDFDAVAAQIGNALSAPAAMRETRTAKAQRFAWPRIAGEYRDFFQQLIGSKGS